MKNNLLSENLSYMGQSPTPTMLYLYTYGPEGIAEKSTKDFSVIRANLKNEKVNWLQIRGLQDTEVIRQVCDHFNVDFLVIQDILNANQPTKIEEYDSYTLLITKLFYLPKLDDDEVQQQQLCLILGNNFVLTFLEQADDFFSDVTAALRKNILKIWNRQPDYLFSVLLNSVMADYNILVTNIDDALEDLEEELLTIHNNRDIGIRIQCLRRHYMTVKRSILPLKEQYVKLFRLGNGTIHKVNRPFYNDVNDHLQLILQTIEICRETLSALVDLYISNNDLRRNDIMKRLTVVSTIFIPLTFLAGVWGMNFENMPELNWKYGYIFAWMIMVATAFIVSLYFRKKSGIERYPTYIRISGNILYNPESCLQMKSIKELYRIGTGPSSSHTMGPRKAAELFLGRHPAPCSYRVTLYGSLAATGKGHMTDVAILDTLEPVAPVELLWEPKIFLPFHPNGMKFEAIDSTGSISDSWTVYSIGGGALAESGHSPSIEQPEAYSMNSMTEILNWCEHTGKSYWEYVKECEDSDIWDYLATVWDTMKEPIRQGLEEEGVLPGPLNLRRKASTYYIRATGYKDSLRSRGLVFAYALAVSEQNASGGKIVTAPTCGSCGVVPAVLYHLQKSRDFSDLRILRALATAGLIGNIVKYNASISGAEVGCQGEAGVACAMASAAANQLFGGSPAQIEYAAEMGLEHHLGMTCDPVCGLVQIPCIERNAYAAARALDANLYASFTDGMHRVSFDKVVAVMKQTGHDLPSLYKETSEGGLAKDYEQM